jgi:EmrB/QacA subfamily drug resistance transporter
LVVLCVGQLMIVLDGTVVNVALPSIQRDLHFSQASLAWVINGYLITFGGLLLLAGRFGDVLGRRRVFITGLGVFTLASLLCGLASTEEWLIAARFFQGVGAAIVSAMVLGILVTLFPERQNMARAMSVYAFVASAGGSIGLLVGGLLTEMISWHWIFFINLPIGIAAMLLGWLLIPDHRGIGMRHGVDVTGALLVTAAPSLAVYTILEASSQGWTSVRTLASGAAAILIAIGFVVFESRISNPLVPLRIFRSRNVVGANLVRALFPMGLFGSFFLGALYLQQVRGYSALLTGVAFLPQNVLVSLFSLFLTTRLLARFGAKATLLPGLVLVAGGLLLFSRAPVAGNYVTDVLPAMLLIGTGAGLFFMPSVSLAMAGASPQDSGLVSGFTNVTLQMGAALGVAILASVSTARTNSLIGSGAATNAALTSGYHLAFLVAAGCIAAAAVLGFVVIRGHRVEQAPAPQRPNRRSVIVTTSLDSADQVRVGRDDGRVPVAAGRGAFAAEES